jgi:hypothetical protein
MPEKHGPSTISLYFFLLNLIPSQQPETTFAPLQVLYMPFLYFLFALPHSSTPLLAPPSSLLPPMVLCFPFMPPPPHLSFLEIILKVSLFMSEQSPPTCLSMMYLVAPKVPQSLTSYFYLQLKLVIMKS